MASMGSGQGRAADRCRDRDPDRDPDPDPASGRAPGAAPVPAASHSASQSASRPGSRPASAAATTCRSDAELIAAARAPGAEGSAAFAELWSRYRRAGLAAARSTAPELDAEDVVSEAYTRILDLTKRGRGPTGEFRPYLYRVVRSIALSWRRVPEVPDEELDTRPATDDRSPWTDLGMEQAAVARAFATLPTRWQEALWRTEVEGLPPRRAAELLGLTPNGVSALARRARAGLREAWAAAHQDGSAPATDACRTHRDRLPARHSGRLAAAQLAALEEHLADCPACAAAADELRRASGLRAAVAREPAPHPR